MAPAASARATVSSASAHLEVQRHADRRVGRVDAVLGVGVGQVEAAAVDVDLAVADPAVVAADEVADDARAEHVGVEREGRVGTGAAGDEVGPQAQCR